jgi:hypothetical protein
MKFKCCIIYGQLNYLRLKIQNICNLLICIWKLQIGNIFATPLHWSIGFTAGFVFRKKIDPLEIISTIMHGIAQPCVEKHIENKECYFDK